MTESKEMRIWFPEPEIEDDSIAQNGEGTFAWLCRSTSRKATDCRRFLNDNIAKVTNWQPKLYHAFQTRDWETVFFELVVGHTLQILGASIEIEVPVAETNKRPDFLATFPDGSITVEAGTTTG